MPTPAEQFAAILREAISGAIQDNKALFDQTINVNNPAGGGGQGGGSGDIVGAIIGLAGLSALQELEGTAVKTALDTVQSSGGAEGLSFSAGYFVASALLQFAEPFTRQFTHMIEALETSQILDPVMAADMVNRGIISDDFGKSQAAGGGFNKDHFSWIRQASANYPAIAQMLAMWNRGYITEANVDKLLTLNGVPVEWQPQIKDMQRELLTPADLALAALRQSITVDEAAAGAAKWGLNADDFNTLMLNTGEPPGTMQLLEAFRRGFIDKPTLAEGIRQSRVRDQWIPTLEKLRYAPMSTAEAANAVVRGYLPQSEGAKVAQDNGLEPDHWQYVLESNGRPPSHEQLASLWLRGKIDLEQFKQGIRESDIKDKYIPEVVDLSVRLLPLFEARTLLNAGEITGKTFASQLLAQGYEKSVVDEILKAAGTGKKATAKHLTSVDYTDLYDAGILDRKQTLDGLVSIGYTEADAEQIVTVAEVKAEAKLQSVLITNVRNQFDRFKLTDKEAEAELGLLGLLPKQGQKLVAEWSVVRPQGTRTLTESQTLKALKDGAIKPDDALQRLRGLGLDEVDALLLMEVYG